MTQKRTPPPETLAMKFLVEEFIDVADGDLSTDAAREGVEKFQRRAAKRLLPGPPGTGGDSLQQLALMRLSVADFQKLRRKVRALLRSLVPDARMGQKVTLRGPVDMRLVAERGQRDRLRRPLIEGRHREDVFWYYLVDLLSRAGLSMIGICRAPRSKREGNATGLERCSRLFVRRGQAKRFCGDTCRARIATQRARQHKGKTEKGKK